MHQTTYPLTLLDQAGNILLIQDLNYRKRDMLRYSNISVQFSL